MNKMLSDPANEKLPHLEEIKKKKSLYTRPRPQNDTNTHNIQISLKCKQKHTNSATHAVSHGRSLAGAARAARPSKKLAGNWRASLRGRLQK